mmetsp:Transcript_19570/g.75136  ORF Transcript_19570/g.75136 Transcript_19570/m.75136 type:complete len:200 (-) Transcript_19570:453-1052(-)
MVLLAHVHRLFPVQHEVEHAEGDLLLGVDGGEEAVAAKECAEVVARNGLSREIVAGEAGDDAVVLEEELHERRGRLHKVHWRTHAGVVVVFSSAEYVVERVPKLVEQRNRLAVGEEVGRRGRGAEVAHHSQPRRLPAVALGRELQREVGRVLELAVPVEQVEVDDAHAALRLVDDLELLHVRVPPLGAGDGRHPELRAE